MEPFNESELIAFLKDEFLTKGGESDLLDALVTFHSDVRQRFSLSERAYREVIARLETQGVVEPIGLDAANGYLLISSAIVEVARKTEESMQAGKMINLLLRTNGEDFTIHPSGGDSKDARGLRNGDGKNGEGRKYIGFRPDTEIFEGDLIESKVSGERFQVVETKKDVFANQLLQVKAYYELAHEKRPNYPSVHFGQVSNSAIMLHSPGSTQNLTFSQTNKNDAVTLVAAIRESLNQMEMTEEMKEELLTHVNYAAALLKKESPKPGVLEAAWEGVHEGLIDITKSGANAATVAVATTLAQQVWQLLTGGSS